MPIVSAAHLVEELVRNHLLTPVQELEVTGDLQAQLPEPRGLAKELLRRGWLTAYQINQIFQGRGAELVLGQYVLLERLGEGGMGQVFKARHQLMNRVDALKVIRPDRLAPEGIQRFKREAQAVARLKHPNIVGLYFADQVNNTLYLAMEYLEGVDLLRLLKQGPQPTAAEACEYVRQAARGLQHAFENDLVHRDVKPSNLLLLRTGPDASTASGGDVVKVLDLGLARLDQRGEAALGSSPLTRAGVLMGTPDYMAPEQAEDFHGADVRADVYSLGCSLYHLLTGRVPYPGRTLMDKLRAHDSAQLPLVRPEGARLADGLEEVVHRMMAKRPEDRYQTPAEVAAALGPYGLSGDRSSTLRCESLTPSSRVIPALPQTLGSAAPPPLPTGVEETAWPARTEKGSKAGPRRRYGLVAAAGGALVLLVLLGVVLVSRRNRPAPQTPDPVAPGPATPKKVEPPTVVVSQKGDGQYATISDAVARVDEGTRLKVRPGVYKESVRLHKRLEIVADGPPGSVVVDTDSGDCITMTADAALVRGLTLRCRAGTRMKKFNAVDAVRGKLLLEDCDLTSDSLSCLSIHGEQSDPVVRRCKIHDGALGAVRVTDGGHGTLEDCDISGHETSQVVVLKGGNPVLRRCRIHDGKLYGIEVRDGGLGRFEACQVYANASAGVIIREGSNPVLTGCHLRDGKQGGLWARGAGTGVLEECEIHGNVKVGVQIEDGANPTLRRCKIHSGKAAGVYVCKKGKGRLEGCLVFRAPGTGVVICEEGDPVLSDCEVHDCDGVGVGVWDKGRGTLEKCRIYGNAKSGVSIQDGGDPVVRACHVNRNAQAGVYSNAKGGGTVEHCDVTKNALGAIVTVPGSTLREKDNVKDGK